VDLRFSQFVASWLASGRHECLAADLLASAKFHQLPIRGVNRRGELVSLGMMLGRMNSPIELDGQQFIVERRGPYVGRMYWRLMAKESPSSTNGN
jgi:hypothetical protein